MDSLIEKYLRDTGIEMCTLKKNGLRVSIPEQERIIHTLLSSYVRQRLEENNVINERP
jgi:hypothetical protein